VHGNKYLQCTLVESAWGATRKNDSYFKRKYESLIARRGRKKALVAVGHKIIIAAYHVIKNKEVYKEPVLHNNQKKKAKRINHLLDKLKELGLEVRKADLAPTA
jgi:transposase